MRNFFLQDLVSDIGVDIKMFYSLFLLVSRSSLQDQFLSYHKQSSSIRNKIRLVTFAVSRDNSSKYILNGDLNISCFSSKHTPPFTMCRTFKAIADLSEKLRKLRVMPAISLYIGQDPRLGLLSDNWLF